MEIQDSMIINPKFHTSLPQRPLLTASPRKSFSSSDPSLYQNRIPRKSFGDVDHSINSNSSLNATKLPSNQKHYSNNLYSHLGGGRNFKKKLSRSMISGSYPLLEALADMEKVLIIRQTLPVLNNRHVKKEVIFSLQNADEELDDEDPLQSQGFSINIEDPNDLVFKLVSGSELYLKEDHLHYCGKFNETLEKKFAQKMFKITIIEDRRTKILGSVRLVEGNYVVFDINGNYMFQVENCSDKRIKAKTIIKRNTNEKREVKLGTIDLEQCNPATLQAAIFYEEACDAKEKLLILGAALGIMMKIPHNSKALHKRDTMMRDACSVGAFWRNIFHKMNSLLNHRNNM